MKFKPRKLDGTTVPGFSGEVDTRIDAALRLYGGAVPEPGLESRVASRLAALPRHSFGSGRLFRSDLFHSKLFRSDFFGATSRPWLVVLRGVSMGALAAAGACAIVVGTVRHSQQLGIQQIAIRPRSLGSIAAGDSHIPTRAPQPSATIDPQAPRTAPRTRSTVSPNPGTKPAPTSAAQH